MVSSGCIQLTATCSDLRNIFLKIEQACKHKAVRKCAAVPSKHTFPSFLADEDHLIFSPLRHHRMLYNGIYKGLWMKLNTSIYSIHNTLRDPSVSSTGNTAFSPNQTSCSLFITQNSHARRTNTCMIHSLCNGLRYLDYSCLAFF